MKSCYLKTLISSIIPFYYAVKYIFKAWLTNLSSKIQLSFYFCCFIFSRFIFFWTSRTDNIRSLNHFMFHFQTKSIKLALQTYPYLVFFAVIKNFLSEGPDCGTVWDVIKKTKKFSERNSNNKLFLKWNLKYYAVAVK